MASCSGLWRMFVLGTVLLIMTSYCYAAHVTVDTTKPIFTVNPEFVSATIDFGVVAVPLTKRRWWNFDFNNPRVTTLLKGLSPCYLRFGGTTADETVFSRTKADIIQNLGTTPPLYTLYPWDFDNLIRWTRASGARLLFDLNINLRYANNWDPVNALTLLRYMEDNSYGENVDFQLGNEPDLDPLHLTGKQLGKDFKVLLKLLAEFPNVARSSLVGADIAGSGGLTSLMPDFLKAVGNNLTATTFHHYYFNGPSAHVSDYINPAHFDTLRSLISHAKSLVRDYSPKKHLPVWIGESADAYNGGTKNVSDRYVSGFLWLDKLGLSAQMGIGVVTRQTFYGGLYQLVSDQLYPNPDYWLSYTHKRLVGQRVFLTNVSDTEEAHNEAHLTWRPHRLAETSTLLIRLYSHCTKPSARYKPGAVTIFGLNLKNTSEIVTFDPQFAKLKVDAYILRPYGKEGLTSQRVALNGKPLRMITDYQLPELHPVSQPAANGVKLADLTFGFWVFPDANIKACM